jgi:acetyl-CoA acyltransferase
VHFAAAAVLSGQADLVVAGGVESMTRVSMGSSAGTGSPFGPLVRGRYAGVEGFEDGAAIPFNQGVGAEMIARRWGQSRAQLDEYSLASHQKAAAAQDAGEFDAEIVPVEVAAHDEAEVARPADRGSGSPGGDPAAVAGTGDGQPGLVSRDEGIRRDTSLSKLGELPTPFREDGVVTAGSASQISDGAAALAITTSEWAAAHGLAPLARIHTAVVAADDPVIMLTAPIPATAKALRRSGLGIDDIDVFEVNEAFAPVPLAWLAETGADPRRVNPRGGAIALGHPLGGSGARIMTTLLAQLRDRGLRYGLQTMCEGGGMANATIIERLPAA